MDDSRESNGRRAARVTVDGDDLFYEVQGEGPPLLLIGGDSWYYYPLAAQLAHRWKVITYDRRANARSTARAPLNFEISQQSRDAIAVLQAAGETSACVVGSSAGAVIALDVAARHPDVVRAVFAFEPPLVRIHPKSAHWQRFFAHVYETTMTFGPALGGLQFALFAGLPIKAMLEAGKLSAAFKEANREAYVSDSISDEVAMMHELLLIVNYLPDIDSLRESGVSVFVGAGAESLAKRRFYAQSASTLADLLKTPLCVVPGNHVSFFEHPDAWAETLNRVFGNGE